ncbi:MAG: hypothetical protein QOJ50_1254 [Cryptosporangiaceae bacterium]|nr:hypothetical protein [Cryptosporangiaceae bacterium]
MIRSRRRVALLGGPVLLVLALSGGGPGPAQADPGPAPRVPDGMPTQDWVDLSSADPQNSSGNAGWGDLPGGVADRPYVTSLTVTNGATQTPVITGATGPAPTPAVERGGVTAVISPVNLCRHDQTPSPGVCYSAPNRVALNVVYGAGGASGSNFADPSETVSPPVTAESVIDMTVALNTLGRSLRWTWVNGDILYWKTTNLGQQDATVRIKFHPATAPYLSTFPSGAGCTATPIFNCNIAKADAEVLSASLLFSLDNTLDPALTGAVFATQNAIAGYLSPQQGAPAGQLALDLQAGSTHTRSDGTPQLGTVEAFLPAGALQNVYGLLPGDAAGAFAVTRAGDPGTNNAPTYQTWTAAGQGSEGLLITVTGVTFSVPKYRVKGKLTLAATQATVKGATATVTATVAACTAKAPCLASVFDLGKASAPRYSAARTTVIGSAVVRAKAVSLAAKSAVLRKGDRYLLVVRSSSTKRAIVSTLGTVR